MRYISIGLKSLWHLRVPTHTTLHSTLSLIHISIWGCAVSDLEIGLDLQFVRQVEYNEIAEKYFSKLENEFINKYGIGGFFQIWTRREAIGKAVAEGFRCV